MDIHVNELNPKDIYETDFYITNNNNGKHLMRFIKIEDRDLQNKPHPHAIFEVFTTVGIKELSKRVDIDKKTVAYGWSSSMTPQKRTITKWRKKLKLTKVDNV